MTGTQPSEDDSILVTSRTRDRFGAINPLNSKRLTVLCAVFLLAISGCIFSPVKKKGDPPKSKPIYPPASSPSIALQVYAEAYANRDSAQIQLVYDDAYLGTSIDRTQPVDLQTSHFTKADEVSHVGRLYRDPSITGVRLDFNSIPNWYSDLNDPVGWATIQTSSVTLDITVGSNSYFLNPTGEFFEFKFIPKTPDSTSPTDTTWKIVRWNEYYNP